MKSKSICEEKMIEKSNNTRITLQNSIDRESGAVIIFVAITLTVMITYAIWVIDLSLVANSREQAQHGARLACVAALEGHLATGNNLGQRMANAVQRATSSTFSHLMLSNPDILKYSDRGHIVGINSTVAPSDAAILVPGQYFWDKDRTDANGVPLIPAVTRAECSGTGRDNCFSPYDPSTVNFLADPPVNAYMIVGRFYEGVSYKLANFLGVNKATPDVRAVCAVVPRHLSFVVDISPSMKAVTHPDSAWYQQRNAPLNFGRGSEYAFFLASDNPDLRETDINGDPVALPDLLHYRLVWEWMSGTIPGKQALCSDPLKLEQGKNLSDTSPDALEVRAYCGNYCRDPLKAQAGPGRICPSVANSTTAPHAIAPPVVGNSAFSRTRYLDDYVKVKTLGDSDYASNPVFKDFHPNPGGDPRLPGFSTTKKSQWYRIDMNDDGIATSGYEGPQPLVSTLHGVWNAITAFQARRVAGDRISAVFYDTEITWPRVFLPTTNFDYILKVLNYSDGFASFGKTQPLDDANNDGTLDIPVGDFVSTAKPGFVQAMRHQLFPGVTNQGKDIFTNTGAALSLASSMLNLSAASSAPSQDDIILITDGLANCVTNTPNCNNTYDSYRAAYQNLFNVVVPSIQNRNVAIHTLLVGANVRPHTAWVRDPLDSSKCLTDESARAPATGGAIPFTYGALGNGYTACGSANPNCLSLVKNYPNNTTAPRNHFANIDGNNPFYQANVDAYQISAGTQGLWLPIRPPLTRLADNSCPTVVPDCTNTPLRLEYDPGCATETDQVTQGINRIVGQVPFMIVEEET